MKVGVVYVVYINKNKPSIPKDHFFKEAICSVKSLKQTHPNLPVTLYTDVNPKIKEFDNVIIISPDNRARLKFEYVYKSPYHYTLYIDSDTKIVGSLIEHFQLLERFDLAAVHDACRAVPERCKIWKAYGNIPNSFGEYCSGLIFFRKSPVVENFFKVWQKNYNYWINNTKFKNDQPSFRVSLWECSDLNIHTLPIEFCVRTQEKINGIRKKYPVKPIIYHWHSMYNKNLNRKPHKIHL